MYTVQKVRDDVWVVHYETIVERSTIPFTSEKEADDYINEQLEQVRDEYSNYNNWIDSNIHSNDNSK